MRIGLLGAGAMAETLGTHWARAGHELLVASRTREHATALATRLGPAAAAVEPRTAAGADAVLLAVRYLAADAVLTAAGAAAGTLTGRPLLDCTNPLRPGTVDLGTAGGPSHAEQVAAVTGAHVVKAFHLCSAAVWRDPPAVDGGPLVVPLAGDDAAALDVAGTLVRATGCTPVVAGGLDRAGVLEAVGAYAIGLYLAGADPQATLPPMASAGPRPDRSQP